FTSQVPLFPGYFFVFGDAEARLLALRTNLVAQSVPVGDQHRLHDDLVRVHRLMGADLPLTPEERLQPGDAVEVIAGPLAGLGGRVLRRGKRFPFFREVELLGGGFPGELDSGMAQPLKTRPADSLPASRGR